MRTGVWLIAGTALGQPYPCRCSSPTPGTWSGQWCGFSGFFEPGCPCFGRTDLRGLTPACCGVRAYLATIQR